MPLDELFQAARAAHARAYAPYSRYRVGAALLADDNRVYAGANVENAAYPQGACAETGAISAMILGGGRRILAAVVLGDGPALCTPCGGCRQRLREFMALDAPVHCGDPEGIRRVFTLDELLPASFGPDHLEKP